MTYYSRNLPHWHPEGATIFLTWRLYGSLPLKDRTARNGCATKQSAGRQFKLLDAVLDKSTTGPHWLKLPRIASIVSALIYKGESALEYFSLHSFVIMPNHIHMLITPNILVPQIMNGLKGATARAGNKILHREGMHFWQDESFDHWVRNPTEFERIKTYIEFNPVSAGLAARPEDLPWSTASRQSK